MGFQHILPLVLFLAPGLAQRNCELCVTVGGDSADPLVGVYRFLEEDSTCAEYGCSYSKDGSPGDVYCFRDGDYQAEAGEECPTESTGSTCKCGLEGERRIVGGEDSTSGKYPWIVSLNAGPAFGSDSHMHNCGGTLVASNWVVTAAHCIVDAGTPKKDDLTVLLGAFDFANDDDTRRKDVALEIDPIVHEDYNNPNQLSNDIALLKLAESVDLNMYTPACMAAKDADYTGKNGRVYGWGSLASCPAQDPTVLQEVEVNIISDEACSAQESDSVTVSNPTNPTECITDSSSYEGRISEEMLCAGAPGKDSCQGDSGGPFTVKSEETNQHDLVGVVSWGDGCAADGMFGVYAEVAKLRDWIDAKIEENGGATFCNLI